MIPLSLDGIQDGVITELYLIYLEVALPNKRRSKKHGGFECCWRQIGGGSK